MSFKIFPLSTCLNGTIILFGDDEPRSILAYPLSKALGYARTSEISKDRYRPIISRYVIKRIDK